jgi:hypothetical protein
VPRPLVVGMLEWEAIRDFALKERGTENKDKPAVKVF